MLSEIRSSDEEISVMWDAELPFRHPWLFLRIDNYFRNIFAIKLFFRKKGRSIATSEYPVRNKVMSFILRLLGVSYSPIKYGNKKIIMYYTSMHSTISPLFLKNIKCLYNKYGESLHVGLGAIATGILGNEPKLSPNNLEKDLQDMKKIGIREVVIFRLGGLTREYQKIIKKYV